ncbi:hypothetical protein [Pseudonocardia sp. ICBG601]|uniref:hypothetical protein n=1 Tax=Pseudonocardia sp. ICBG601 TaxID=2846759 RepID=UPI001CF621D1|nr:hypothetical protein [Pseudonocardia sp. ICBG601]
MSKKKQRRADPDRKARRRAQLKARELDHALDLVSHALDGTIVVNADYHQHDDGTWSATVVPEGAPSPVTIGDADPHALFHKVIAIVDTYVEFSPLSDAISTITLHRVDGDTDRWADTVTAYGFADCVIAAQFPDR